MLLFFDLAKLKHPKGISRIGPKMREEIRELVQDRVHDPASNPLPLDQLSVRSTQGKKLHVFCEQFGTGSLFILQEHLLDNL